MAGMVFTSSIPLAAELPPIRESRPASKQAAPFMSDTSTDNDGNKIDLSRLSTKERLSRLEKLLDSQAMVEMYISMDGLQQDIQEFRGQSEMDAHRLKRIEERQRELFIDFDRRLRQIEIELSKRPVEALPGTTTPTLGSANGTASGEVDTGDNAVAGVDPRKEQEEYQKALEILRSDRYGEAIRAFKQFLTVYPTGVYAVNAQYWLGEANYVMRRFEQAIKEFTKVMELNPKSSKSPDAMLKMGYSYYEIKDWKGARKVLNDLVKQFPDTTAAELAQNRLHRINVEGK